MPQIVGTIVSRRRIRTAFVFSLIIGVVILGSADLFPRVSAWWNAGDPDDFAASITDCTVTLTTQFGDWDGGADFGRISINIADFTPTEYTVGCGIAADVCSCPNDPEVGGACTPNDEEGGGGGYTAHTAADITFVYSGSGGTLNAANFVFTNTTGTPFHGGFPTVTGAFPITLPDCSPPDSGSGDDSVNSNYEPPLPEYDPPGSPPRVWGGYFQQASELVVYGAPYGYLFYTWQGSPLGLVDFNEVGIPNAREMITSVGNDQWRVDIYYLHSDTVQANMYNAGGVLVEEAVFEVAGIGARAGEVAGASAPQPGEPLPDATGATGDTAVAAEPDTIQLACNQNLRQEASIDTPVLVTMHAGSPLSVLGRSNDNSWLNVTTADGITGWVFNGSCVDVSAPVLERAPVEMVFEGQPDLGSDDTIVEAPSAAPVAASAPAAGAPVIGIVCNQNMRTGPGTDFAVDRILQPGDQASVVGRSSDGSWLQVDMAGASGWTYFGQCVLPQAGDVTAAPVTVAFGQ